MKFNLLSNPTTNYKANKNITIGYNTYFLSLAHSDISGYNVCPFANKLKAGEQNKNKSFCSSICVGANGFAQIFKSVMKARIRKTKLYFEDRPLFIQQLIIDINKAIKQSIKANRIPTFRLNAYSDIQWEKIKIYDADNNKNYNNIFELFPDIKFYDYTKIPNRITPKNYELTYSYYGNNNHLKTELNTNKNIAIVFDKLPKKYKNKLVVNGDKTDLRLADNDGKNIIVGLKFKGSKKALQNGIKEGFVIDTSK